MAPRKNNEPASWELDADKPKPKGETRVRRSYCTKELTMRPAHGVDTVHDIMLYASRHHGDKGGFGTRDVLEVYHEPLSPATSLRSGQSAGSSATSVARQGERLRLGPVKFMSYTEALQEVRDLGSGLRELGVGLRGNRGFFAIYSGTSRNWMMMAQACAFNGAPICTVYNTATQTVLGECLVEAEAEGVFTNADLLPNLERLIAKTNIKLIVYDGKADPATLENLRGYENIEIMTIDELRDIGLENPHVQAHRAKREEVFCCMYTSGGGGKPKGVLLTHGAVCSAVGSSHGIMGDILEGEDVYLAFLPQAHILEFAVEMTFIFAGLPIAYGRIKTLTDAGVKYCKNDIQEIRPSMMIAVPQVWELLRKGILSKVEESGALKKAVFNMAVKAKSQAIQKSIPGVIGVTNALVFKQVQQSTGGRLRTLFNGGSAIARSTQAFLSAALVQMIQGYGLTEGTAMACLCHPHWPTFGAVGGPMPGVEIKLVDRPEEGLGYFSHDNPPRGEIYIRGPAMFKGYYKRPGLDAIAFTPDGWFKTGDIGQWNKDGTLNVIDRVKNHVRLAQGRYVLLERLEAIYKGCTFVYNGCIIPDVGHHNPAMVVVAHPTNLASFAKKNGFNNYPNLESLCSNPRFVDACRNELNAVAKREGLKGAELLEAVILTTDEWTPESGFLTAAQKLRRYQIEYHYFEEINKVYKITEPKSDVAPIPTSPLPTVEQNITRPHRTRMTIAKTHGHGNGYGHRDGPGSAPVTATGASFPGSKGIGIGIDGAHPVSRTKSKSIHRQGFASARDFPRPPPSRSVPNLATGLTNLTVNLPGADLRGMGMMRGEDDEGDDDSETETDSELETEEDTRSGGTSVKEKRKGSVLPPLDFFPIPPSSPPASVRTSNQW